MTVKVLSVPNMNICFMRMMNCLTKKIIKQNNKNRIKYGNIITCTLLLRIVARPCLVVGISPISDKAKIRFMYVGAALSLMVVPSAAKPT